MHRHRRNMRLYSANGPHEVIAKTITTLFSKAIRGNHYILFFTDRCLKVTRAPQTLKNPVMYIVYLFTNYWLMSYNLLAYLLTDKESHFVRILFATMLTLFEAKQLLTTAYHKQTNCQDKQFSEVIHNRLLQNVAKQQKI